MKIFRMKSFNMKYNKMNKVIYIHKAKGYGNIFKLNTNCVCSKNLSQKNIYELRII